MAIRLMSMRGVPDDELDDICVLFDKNAISYYVTPPGNLFISAGALWLDDESQLQQAHALLNSYQQQRSQRAQDEFAESRQKGEQAGIFDRIFENPVRFIGYLIILGFVLYISVMPFLDFGK
ncbi:MAG: hypothetical protein BMS9Abin25_0778 [Gammaproteobacteria bacterium]|nr:MAG: hypothetical protein BMS9Abin25_0778 [Gammaproteobacteria bacterium]